MGIIERTFKTFLREYLPRPPQVDILRHGH